MITPYPTTQRVKELFDYNTKTGLFTWRIARRGTCSIGSVAGSVRKKGPSAGRRYISVDGVKYTAAQLVFIYFGKSVPATIDHKDRDCGNDRRSNLRASSPVQQNRNRRRLAVNRSGVTGVGFHKRSGLWRARIKNSLKEETLGYSRTKHGAILLRYCGELRSGWQKDHDSTDAEKYRNAFFAYGVIQEPCQF